MAKNILVVEDDANLRSILSEGLKREGYNVAQAKNGEEGLALALSGHPDLILLDIILPSMDGVSVLSQIREDEEWGKNVKVIMLTNLNDSQSVAACLALGAHSFLVKADWTIEDIMNTIKDELKNAPANNPS